MFAKRIYRKRVVITGAITGVRVQGAAHLIAGVTRFFIFVIIIIFRQMTNDDCGLIDKMISNNNWV